MPLHSPSRWQWRLLLIAALAIVALWPPEGGRSLAISFVRWAVDPAGRLPVLPAQLPLGAGDDPVAVEARDAEVRRYDAALAQGGWTRMRVRLKVARDPVRPSTMRQGLVAAAVGLAFIAWRIAAGPRTSA